MTGNRPSFDRTNALVAGLVFLISLIVYSRTVQPTLSFWDCGEFIACAHILGIPHPPGTPLFVLIGRIFSLIPMVEDISHRINYLSVVSSAATAMFSYLLTVRVVRYFFAEGEFTGFNRTIAYVGGVAGGLFVAFGRTNWANSNEAEVYGLALALSVAVVWLALQYFEQRGTLKSTRTMVLAIYLALLGVGIHMTVFLVVPVAAIFFLLKKDAETRDWGYICGFVILELLLIFAFADGVGFEAFLFVSAVLAMVLLGLLYKKIKWAVAIAIASIAAVMMSFSLYLTLVPFAFAGLLLIGLYARSRGWQFEWKTGLALIFIAFVGLSVHAYIPVRSELSPRIDENNPSRDWRTFMNFLDRKQYGQESMVERMFHRRGTAENQFGRHANMGFWSYFEDQYSPTGWSFIPFLLLGLYGMYVAIRKRLEIGLPFFTLFLFCSVGLILYMNFADGTKYNELTQDAYLEVRNRDYFFTPAFVFFGIAMGLGVSALLKLAKERAGQSVATLGCLLVLLPGFSLAHNYYANDRSKDFSPYNYAANLLDSCEPNSILFTSGDNDTFPVWCIQEVYGYRLDVTVINLSLLNTDWYVYQMKHQYGVPISLSDEQILWYPVEVRKGLEVNQPKQPFSDRPRGRRTLMVPTEHEGRVVRVQDMLVDEIVIENKFQRPIFFSSPPYAESPLKLREKATSVGIVYRLERQNVESDIDVDTSYDLFMNVYRFDGYNTPEISRDENATGVYIGFGVNSTRVFDELVARSDFERARLLGEHIASVYPEYWQNYLLLADLYTRQFNDTARADELFAAMHDTLTAFHRCNPENLFYMQDLGIAKVQYGLRNSDTTMIDDGINNYLWPAFELNANSNHAYRKLISSLSQVGRYDEIRRATQMFAEYKINRRDPLVQQLMGMPGGG